MANTCYLLVAGLKTNLIMKTILLPFLITFLVLTLNEVRLFKIKSINYKTMINSIAILLIGLLSFIGLQIFFERLL